MNDEVKPKTRRGPRDKHKHGIRMSLSEVREAFGKTQQEVAKTIGICQGDVSKLENRGNVRVSSLKRYAAALGGNLEVVIVGPLGHRMIVPYTVSVCDWCKSDIGEQYYLIDSELICLQCKESRDKAITEAIQSVKFKLTK